jgi:hypothetical protein
VELDTWGSEFGDLAFPSGWDLLVSVRFRHIYETSHLTGLRDFEAVEVVKITRHARLVGDPPEYAKASVGFSDATIDQQASGMEWTEPPTCPLCMLGNGLRRWSGIVIRDESWRGEDIFFARGKAAGMFIVTARFKSVCEQNGITNAVFVPAETYAVDFWDARTTASR